MVNILIPTTAYSNMLDAREFGVQGNGADDGPAINAGIETLAAQGGGTLFLPFCSNGSGQSANGYAIYTPVMAASGVRLLGEGGANPTKLLQGTGLTTSPVIVAPGVSADYFGGNDPQGYISGFTLENIAIMGNGNQFIKPAGGACNVPVAVAAGATTFDVNNQWGLEVGLLVSGTGIAAGTTIASLAGNYSTSRLQITLSAPTTAAIAANTKLTLSCATVTTTTSVAAAALANQLTLTSAAGVVPGMALSGETAVFGWNSVPYVIAVNGNVITISQPLVYALSAGSSITFAPARITRIADFRAMYMPQIKNCHFINPVGQTLYMEECWDGFIDDGCTFTEGGICNVFGGVAPGQFFDPDIAAIETRCGFTIGIPSVQIKSPNKTGNDTFNTMRFGKLRFETAPLSGPQLLIYGGNGVDFWFDGCKWESLESVRPLVMMFDQNCIEFGTSWITGCGNAHLPSWAPWTTATATSQAGAAYAKAGNAPAVLYLNNCFAVQGTIRGGIIGGAPKIWENHTKLVGCTRVQLDYAVLYGTQAILSGHDFVAADTGSTDVRITGAITAWGNIPMSLSNVVY
jgi:hypothetical protein